MSAEAFEALEAFVALHRDSRRRALPRSERGERDALDERLRDLIDGARPAPRELPNPSPLTSSEPSRPADPPPVRASSRRGSGPASGAVSVTAVASRVEPPVEALTLASKDARRLNRVDPRERPASTYTPPRRPAFLDAYYDDTVDPSLEAPESPPIKVVDASGAPVELSSTTRDLWGLGRGTEVQPPRTDPPAPAPARLGEPATEPPPPIPAPPTPIPAPRSPAPPTPIPAPRSPAPPTPPSPSPRRRSRARDEVRVEAVRVEPVAPSKPSAPASPGGAEESSPSVPATAPKTPALRPTSPPSPHVPVTTQAAPPTASKEADPLTTAPAGSPIFASSMPSLPPAIVHLLQGGTVRGYIESFEASEGRILVRGRDESPETQEIRLDEVLLIFFARRREDPPTPKQGSRVDVTLANGKRVVGFSPDYRTGGSALTLVPASDRGGVDRMWIPAWSVKSIVLD